MGKARGGSTKDFPSKATEEIKMKKEPTRKVVSSQKKGFLGNASPAKSKGVNKVFVTATTNGVLLLRTERPYSKDDAFTNTFGEKLSSDPDYMQLSLTSKRYAIVESLPKKMYLSSHQEDGILNNM